MYKNKTSTFKEMYEEFIGWKNSWQSIKNRLMGNINDELYDDLTQFYRFLTVFLYQWRNSIKVDKRIL